MEKQVEINPWRTRNGQAKELGIFLIVKNSKGLKTWDSGWDIPTNLTLPHDSETSQLHSMKRKFQKIKGSIL